MCGVQIHCFLSIMKSAREDAAYVNNLFSELLCTLLRSTISLLLYLTLHGKK